VTEKRPEECIILSTEWRIPGVGMFDPGKVLLKVLCFCHMLPGLKKSDDGPPTVATMAEEQYCDYIGATLRFPSEEIKERKKSGL